MSPAGGTGADRRAHPRAALRTAVRYRADGRPEQGESYDLSAGGMRFVAPARVPASTRLELCFALPDAPEPLELAGVVAYVETLDGDAAPRRYAIGVRFIDAGTDTRERIERACRGASAPPDRNRRP